jgi:hypothetical protein
VPQRETRAILGALLLRRTTIGEPHVTEWTTTATDVLRLAVALCGGDVSLAEKTRFSFNRPHRRLLLALLDRIPGAAADMRRHREAWKRLGHSLHAGEYRRRYPSAFAAVDAIRGASSVPTERTPVEAALRNRDLRAATRSLASRPGDFARRLDHLLRLDPVTADSIIDAFAVVADGVSTPVLLSVAHHFAMRTDAPPVRVFFPKGITAKAHMANDGRGVIDATVCQRVVTVAEQALLDRFAVLPPMGRVYVDPALLRCPIPHAGRSASASSRSLARGTRLPLPPGGTVRFFVWWRDGEERTDIDLSAVLYSADLRHLEDIAYYNLKTFGGHHSGDIVAAPDGASEFVDLDLAAVAARGARYIGMVVTVFTGQQFKQLPECTAGWMIRTHAGSGEVYDPRTVVDRLDIGAASRIAMPLLIDVTDRSAVWCDLSVRSNAMRVNAAFHNRTTLSFMIGATIGSTYPSLHRLMSLHAQARGLIVGDPAEADITFTLAEGFPFQVERIADSFLA